MLVVSRVDVVGRAYAVTNFNSPQGYVIQEVMLYDPTLPKAGKFYEWTDRKNSRYGLTGFGGFRIWRFQAPIQELTPLELELAAEIDSVIAQVGGNWHVIFKEAGGREFYSRRTRDAIHPASVIKLPIAMLTMKWLETASNGDLQAGLMDGIDGRSFEQLLRAMLVDSEESATESLLKNLRRSRFDTTSVLQAWNASTTDIVQRISSARDLAFLFEGLYRNALTPPSREMILHLLSVYTPGDDTRLGLLRKSLPSGSRFYNKRGTITQGLLTVSDCALVEIPITGGKRVFTLGVFSFRGTNKITYEDLFMGMEQIAGIFAKYLSRV
jgi:hypothetical protein